MVLPVLRRVRHPYPPEAAPMHVFVPPGVWTGFGIDFGPAFTHVSAAQVERWGVDHATLLGTALENLRALTVVEPPQVERIQPGRRRDHRDPGPGLGIGAHPLPEVLRPILGEGPPASPGPGPQHAARPPRGCRPGPCLPHMGGGRGRLSRRTGHQPAALDRYDRSHGWRRRPGVAPTDRASRGRRAIRWRGRATSGATFGGQVAATRRVPRIPARARRSGGGRARG